jgi:hypothetical protein
MPPKRLQTQISIAVLISLSIGLLFFIIPVRGESLHLQRTAYVTLLPDYANDQVMIVGMVSSPKGISAEVAKLGDWGFDGALDVWASGSAEGNQSYYLQGILSNAFLELPGESGRYKITLGPFHLPPGDTLAITIPFASLTIEDVSPEPHNLDEIKNPRVPVTNLRYSAGKDPLDLTLEIPFVPVKKEIDLNLFPLVGELIQKRRDSYRLFGQVIFKDIPDYPAFEKYCQWTVEDPFWPYRMADTLFSLDYLPIFHFGYLPPAYQYKPTYLLVRSELQSCSYDNGAGQVVTGITGRVFNQPVDPARFPKFLLDQDVPDQQVEIQERGIGTGIYEIQLGYIFLGPGDVLKVTLPGTDIRSISPAPSRFSYTETGQTQAEFDGPGKFVLNVRYAPRPEVFVKQLPATIRAFGFEVEKLLSSLNTGLGTWQPWLILVACVALLAVVERFSYPLKLWGIVFLWLIAGVLCYYSFRHVFGLILFATGVNLLASWKTGSRKAILKSILTTLTAIVILILDTKAKELVYMLDGYNLELTLFTPSLLIVFGLVVLLIYRNPKEKLTWAPRDFVGPAILLFALSVLDGLQKSLPALLFTGGLVLVILRRFYKLSDNGETDSTLGIPDRFKTAWRSSFLWIGLFALSIFVISNDVTSTAEVLAPKLGVLRFLLDPVLLFLSATLSFLATGGLFLILYPVLPFKEGYLKAIGFAAGLWVIFILGVGADDRLVIALPGMLAGRFIYYLSAPLLAGIYMENQTEREAEKADGRASKADKKVVKTGFSIERILDPLKSLLGPVGSLISLVAPGLYAWFSGQPLITSYFDVLDVLIQFTLI